MLAFNVNAAVDVSTYIPKNAPTYIPTVAEQLQLIYPEFKVKHYVPALIEHESCITLTGKSCWNPKTEFITHRERGSGLGQLTKTFDKNGKIRNDTLTSLRNQNKELLRELSWSNITSRPDLQIRAIILLMRSNHKAFANIPGYFSRLAFTDASYNSGLGNVNRDRRQCRLRANCDPNLWFGNVEVNCTLSRKILYGKRSACDINRNHVKDVLTVRLDKYLPLM